MLHVMPPDHSMACMAFHDANATDRAPSQRAQDEN